MNLEFDLAATIKRELKVCTRVLNNPNKYSKETIDLFQQAQKSAEERHGIYAHPKPFQTTCQAYGALIPFPASKHKVDS